MTNKEEEGDDDYCGFLCSDIIERQQQILDEIEEFSKVNPEFAQIMLGRIIKLVLPRIQETTSPPI